MALRDRQSVKYKSAKNVVFFGESAKFDSLEKKKDLYGIIIITYTYTLCVLTEHVYAHCIGTCICTLYMYMYMVWCTFWHCTFDFSCTCRYVLLPAHLDTHWNKMGVLSQALDLLENMRKANILPSDEVCPLHNTYMYMYMYAYT